MTSITQLNEKFGLAGRLTFADGQGDLPVAEISNDQATARVALHGAHVLAYQPHGQEPVIWLSEFAEYRPGKAIRGGIPVCWPWFGPHPNDPELPAHGLARINMWQVSGSAEVEGVTQLRLSLHDGDETRPLWPHSFSLELIVTVGQTLRVELVATNRDDEPVICGGALHSYFAISDIADIKIEGLAGVGYVDKMDEERLKTQVGPITFEAETDRVYLETTDTCFIDDPGFGRRIRVAKVGSRTTVVWNPWIAKAQRMGDFGDTEYRTMVCVETANAEDDTIILHPNNTHRLVTEIGVVDLDE